MSRWLYFLWLFRQTGYGLLYPWPVTAALVCLVAIGLVLARRQLSTGLRGWFFQLAPFVIPVAVLAVGSIYQCESCSPSSVGQGVRHAWAAHLIDALLLVQIGAAVWLVSKAKGWRLMSSAIQALSLWCTVWASFLAGMSISGDWL